MDKTSPTKSKPLVDCTCKLGTKGCFTDGRCHAIGNCKNKIVTKADRIRAMNDEELARFMSALAYGGETPWSKPFEMKFCKSCPTVKATLETGKEMQLHECDFADGKCPHGDEIIWWLKQPAAEAEKEWKTKLVDAEQAAVATEREMDELRAQLKEAEEKLEDAGADDRAEKERLEKEVEALSKRLMMSDRTVAVFQVHFDSVQKAWAELRRLLDEMSTEQRPKMATALKALAAKINEEANHVDA